MKATAVDSEFIAHEPCPWCHSKDNLARYSDGHAYCFGCRYYEPAPYRISHLEPIVKPQPEQVRYWPDDAKPQLGAKAWQWLTKYGILEKDAKDFLWSDEKEWLIFPFYDANRSIIAWQARNFNPVRPKPKYLTFGSASNVLHFVGKGDIVVLTEDLLSAIKVGRSPGIVGMPVFGSTVSLKTLTRLRTLFKSVGIWLDMDKASESVRARQRASQLGFEQVFSILTEKDPKEYTNMQINEHIVGALEV